MWMSERQRTISCRRRLARVHVVAVARRHHHLEYRHGLSSDYPSHQQSEHAVKRIYTCRDGTDIEMIAPCRHNG